MRRSKQTPATQLCSNTIAQALSSSSSSSSSSSASSFLLLLPLLPLLLLLLLLLFLLTFFSFFLSFFLSSSCRNTDIDIGGAPGILTAKPGNRQR